MIHSGFGFFDMWFTWHAVLSKISKEIPLDGEFWDFFAHWNTQQNSNTVCLPTASNLKCINEVEFLLFYFYNWEAETVFSFCVLCTFWCTIVHNVIHWKVSVRTKRPSTKTLGGGFRKGKRPTTYLACIYHSKSSKLFPKCKTTVLASFPWTVCEENPWTVDWQAFGIQAQCDVWGTVHGDNNIKNMSTVSLLPVKDRTQNRTFHLVVSLGSGRHLSNNVQAPRKTIDSFIKATVYTNKLRQRYFEGFQVLSWL